MIGNTFLCKFSQKQLALLMQSQKPLILKAVGSQCSTFLCSLPAIFGNPLPGVPAAVENSFDYTVVASDKMDKN